MTKIDISEADTVTIDKQTTQLSLYIAILIISYSDVECVN